MNRSRAYVRQSQFEAEVQKIAKSLAPDVVRIDVEVGEDWAGEPAAFAMVILDDAATVKERLHPTAERVHNALWDQIEPLEEWGVFLYTSFRSRSEQAKIDERVVA